MIRTVAMLMVLAPTLACGGQAAKPSPKAFWKWYTTFPRMQEFYPVGLYGDGTWTATLCSDMRQRIDMTTEVFARYNVNTNWSTHLRFCQSHVGPTGHLQCWPDHYKPRLNDLGKWYYGEVLPRYEVYSLTGLAAWLRYNTGVWKRHPEMARDYPALTSDEMKTVADDLTDVFAYCRDLRTTYPYVAGYITDDEPHLYAPSTASNHLVETYAKAPAMTCKPTFAGLMKIARGMPAITGDWYFHMNDGNSWDMARRLRTFNATYPGKVFWFMAWCCASGRESNEPTQPDLKDSRITHAKLRLEVWQAVALGCKGLFAFIPGGGTPGYRGGAGLVDSLMRPTPTNGGMLHEYGRLGGVLDTVGPLLLSCYPEPASPVKVKCASYRNIFYAGPVVDHGVLRDATSKRWYIVPWNNHPDLGTTAELVLPKDLPADARVYDMVALREVPLQQGRLQMKLEPGGGRILLVGTPDLFEASRQRVLAKRCRRPRVLTRAAYAFAKTWKVDLKETDALLATAQKAETDRQWEQAQTSYQKAGAAIDRQLKRQRRYVCYARQQLDEVARVLSETEELLRCNMRLLDLPAHVNHVPTMYANKHAGKEVRHWVGLVRFYYDILHSLRQRSWGGGGYTYLATAQSCKEWAVANRDAVRAAIDRRRQAVRRPLRVALITPDRIDVEYDEVYAWFYDYADVRWFAPRKGALLDRKNRALRLDEFDTVWVHQLRFRREGGPATPAEALMPSILKPAFMKKLKGFVENGGGLLLTGMAGLYVEPLGLETHRPDRVASMRPVRGSMGVGVVPAPGFADHPVFARFKKLGLMSDEGFFTSGGGLCCELAWKKSRPTGRVVASLRDAAYGLVSEHAVVVEYALGKGKVVVMDGQTIDMTPRRGYAIAVRPSDKNGWLPDPIRNRSNFGFRARNRTLALDALSYLAGNDRFQPDPKVAEAAEAVRRKAEDIRRRTVWLPKDKWRFKLDPDDVGETGRWFAKKFDDRAWKPILIGRAWEAQGYDYDGYAWYRRTVRLGNRPGRKAVLHFGAVDEKAWVWIDGRQVGEADAGWDKPFHFDISAYLGDTEKEHQITVRVHDHMAAGGIWKPVWVLYE